MGATNFRTTAKGRTMDGAFNDAVDQALYEYGHGGYTGTIAEKRGVRSFAVPAGVEPKTFIDWIELAELDEELPAAANPYRATIRAAAKVYGDKWGPAVGIEVAGPDKDGNRTFVFIGLASE